jgi:hypothetical protein
VSLINITVAADVGKKMDSKAIAAVERISPDPPVTGTSQWRTTWKVPIRESVFLVRELGRLPMGMSYTKQVEHIALAAHSVCCLDPDGSLSVLLDATGVGEGTADLLQRYLPGEVKTAEGVIHVQRAHGAGSERVQGGQTLDDLKAHELDRDRRVKLATLPSTSISCRSCRALSTGSPVPGTTRRTPGAGRGAR